MLNTSCYNTEVNALLSINNENTKYSNGPQPMFPPYACPIAPIPILLMFPIPLRKVAIIMIMRRIMMMIIIMVGQGGLFGKWLSLQFLATVFFVDNLF